MTMEIPTPACALVRNDTNIENAAAYTNSPLTSAGGQGCVPHGSAHHRTTPSGSGQERTHIKFVTAWLRALPGKRSFTAKKQTRLTRICFSHSEFTGPPSGKEQQAHPGDHVLAVLKFQAEFFQQGDHVDPLALHAGVHGPRHPAGQAV